MSYAGTLPLFAPGPNPRAPALPWRSDDFTAVDDRVRGGTSHSRTAIVQYPSQSRGELVFSGFLDTTTLGGSGFASQASTTPPPVTLAKTDFSGLRLVIRREPNWSEPSPIPPGGSNPGGGKRPVTSFVFQIKTEKPRRRPDGRRESGVVWEWSFTVPQTQEGMKGSRVNPVLSNEEFWVFDSTWEDFKPSYRGRPVDKDTAGEFQPEQTYEWSFMARSNFQAQSGPFALQMHSLSALPLEDQFQSTYPPHSSSTSPLPVEEESTLDAPPQNWVDEKAVLWIGWIAWALTPDEVLQKVGIAWYPNREWAFLLPAWSLFVVLAVYAIFIGLNARNTPELEDINNVTDSVQNLYRISMQDEVHLFEDEKMLAHSLHDIYDLPPTYVSRQIHL
ncbi:hypothetical protein NDA11_001095 [Ustilago hordei]|uniref:uncharacterized protein n=1 Tax=Ustilago hordei TaxID=120017 RepID=UPI001A3D40AA|nr:uncharacterized protein UHO2_07303 [Ustilago hordei]KAJ1045049.1 hypothetical protein NDA10_006142 [Ustilago hordei]KAJ1572022.1 hypothetical protein NDA15_002884 [Ustilago hordei]KAJ1573429.1 hypothetical protein NDA11_001095 [Ustilago hordei]KAJ1594471.1 hypothetical protein NDA12_005465 [Ustilago hordei]KAJ1598333.1 hypothetical protein NDA14_005446 [Ustilago hordei]